MKSIIDSIEVFHSNGSDRYSVNILSQYIIYEYTFQRKGLFVDIDKLKECAKMMFQNGFFMTRYYEYDVGLSK